MNARTDLPAVADSAATPARSDLARWLARGRNRLMSWRRPHRVMLSWGVSAPTQPGAAAVAAQAFEAWAAQHAGAAVELLLSSHCLLMLADDGDDGDADATDARALRERAIERWTHYLALPAEGFEHEWLVQTSLDPGRSPVALACAMPRAWRDSLQEVAGRHGVKLLAVQPWWASGLQQAWRGLPAPVAAVAAVDAGQPAENGAGRATRLWAWREGGWQTQARAVAEPGRWALRSLAFVTDAADADQADPASAVDEVWDAPAPTSVPAIATVAPLAAPALTATRPSLLTRRAGTDWAESLNFAGPRVRTSFWSWALLALGAIAVVHALELAGQVAQAQAAAQAEWERLQAHAQSSGQVNESVTGPGTPAAAPGSPAAHAPTLQPDAWRSAAQLAAWLGHPWAVALDHADATAHRHGISLTRVQLDLSTWGTSADQTLAWRLQAAVPDDASALAWVRDLGPQAELQRRDALPQPVASERGTLAWRIDVSVAGGQP